MCTKFLQFLNFSKAFLSPLQKPVLHLTFMFYCLCYHSFSALKPSPPYSLTLFNNQVDPPVSLGHRTVHFSVVQFYTIPENEFTQELKREGFNFILNIYWGVIEKYCECLKFKERHYSKRCIAVITYIASKYSILIWANWFHHSCHFLKHFCKSFVMNVLVFSSSLPW